MTKWFDQPPWPERFAGGWKNMSKEHRREFMELSWQNHLKSEYEWALEFYNVEGAPWEELTQEQRDGVEHRVKQHAQDMHELGKSLSQGETP